MYINKDLICICFIYFGEKISQIKNAYKVWWLDKHGPCRLIYFNVWFPIDGTV